MANWSTQTATRECKIESNGELTVVERLANLLETGQYADVTITVGGGDDVVTFKAHRLLLATASEPLNQMVSSTLGGDGTPGGNAPIRVTDVDPEAFQHILRYIYTDDLEISNTSESLTLLKVSKKWSLQSLLSKTIKFLDDFLNEYEPISEELKNELCDLTVLVEEYAPSLLEKCWKVLIKNVNDVIPCQGFLNMSKEMIRRILNHSGFQFKNQLVLFEAIRDWGMNQVLEQNLNVNSLQELIGEFLQHVDFRAIKDLDFIDTIMPSECLGKADLISFFMARGLEIPRDLAFNNNNRGDSSLPYEKTGRYKRGFKLPNQEIYKEHELRFRVDQKLRLLGVGFGFLFSNTDMGITVHCQGPWETRQWKDIIQTYCRVTWEKMKTADVRLMFSEPVVIEANQCYKILVRISRMSSGTSDVELWGGTQGVSRLTMKDAEFSFLKSAVDPQKKVEDSETENKPSMITDLFYELCDEDSGKLPPGGYQKQSFNTSCNGDDAKAMTNGVGSSSSTRSTPLSPTGRSTKSNIFNSVNERTASRALGRPSLYGDGSSITTNTSRYPFRSESGQPDLKESGPTIKKNFDPGPRREDTFGPKSSDKTSEKHETYSSGSTSLSSRGTLSSSLDVNQDGTREMQPLSYRKTAQLSRYDETEPYSKSKTWRKKSQADEASSYYLSQKPSSIKESNTIPAFLRSRQASVEKSKPSWLIPSRKSTVSTINERFNNTDFSLAKETNTTRRLSKNSDIFDNTPLSKYSQGISHYRSKYDSGSSRDTPSFSSKYGSDRFKRDEDSRFRSKYDTKTSSDADGGLNSNRNKINSTDNRYISKYDKTPSKELTQITPIESKYSLNSSSNFGLSSISTTKDSTQTCSKYDSYSRNYNRPSNMMNQESKYHNRTSINDSSPQQTNDSSRTQFSTFKPDSNPNSYTSRLGSRSDNLRTSESRYSSKPSYLMSTNPSSKENSSSTFRSKTPSNYSSSYGRSIPTSQNKSDSVTDSRNYTDGTTSSKNNKGYSSSDAMSSRISRFLNTPSYDQTHSNESDSVYGRRPGLPSPSLGSRRFGSSTSSAVGTSESSNRYGSTTVGEGTALSRPNKYDATIPTSTTSAGKNSSYVGESTALSRPNKYAPTTHTSVGRNSSYRSATPSTQLSSRKMTPAGQSNPTPERTSCTVPSSRTDSSSTTPNYTTSERIGLRTPYSNSSSRFGNSLYRR